MIPSNIYSITMQAPILLGFLYRTKGKFPSQKIGVTYKAGNLEHAITKLPQEFTNNAFSFLYTHFGRKNPSVSKLNLHIEHNHLYC